MPIYEFQCTDCKEVFEDLVPVGQKHHTCPVCGAKAKKMISQVGIIFKGSGWYCTDSRKAEINGNGRKKPATKADKSKSEEKKTDKSDEVSKPVKSSKKKDTE